MKIPLYTVSVLGLVQVLLGGPQAGRAKRIVPVKPDIEKAFVDEVKTAVVVGVGDYPPRSGLRALKYAAEDAKQIASELKKQGYATATLTDGQATAPILRKTLKDLAEMVDGKQGTVLFYFSGHGFGIHGRNYLATSDATAFSIDSSGVPLDEVEELLRATGAPRQILLIDACRNEPGEADKSANLRSFQDFRGSAGMKELFSTKPGQVSYESDDLRHGVFTHFALAGLRGEASGSDGLVTFQDLAQYVTASVRSWGFEKGQLQVPFDTGEASGDFLIARGGPGPGIPDQPASGRPATTEALGTASIVEESLEVKSFKVQRRNYWTSTHEEGVLSISKNRLAFKAIAPDTDGKHDFSVPCSSLKRAVSFGGFATLPSMSLFLTIGRYWFDVNYSSATSTAIMRAISAACDRPLKGKGQQLTIK